MSALLASHTLAAALASLLHPLAPPTASSTRLPLTSYLLHLSNLRP